MKCFKFPTPSKSRTILLLVDDYDLLARYIPTQQQKRTDAVVHLLQNKGQPVLSVNNYVIHDAHCHDLPRDSDGPSD